MFECRLTMGCSCQPSYCARASRALFHSAAAEPNSLGCRISLLQTDQESNACSLLGPLSFESPDVDERSDWCGTTGTVAVTVLHSTPEQVRRFCEDCRPAERESWESEREEESTAWFRQNMRAGPYDRSAKPPKSRSGSRSWHDDRMHRPMPPKIAAFVERYSRAAS